jgi:hypothetical protein
MKANHPPVKYTNKLIKYTTNEALRVLMQASRKTGSTGHGANLPRHCIYPLMVSITPAKVNTSILRSLIQTIFGKIEINVDKVAPAPKVTSRAGIAQQIRVLELAKRVTKLAQKLLLGAMIFSEIICLSPILLLSQLQTWVLTLL